MASIYAQTERRLQRIAEDDPALRAFIRVDADDARDAARAADRHLFSGGTDRALDGVITAVKDNLAVGGKAWTAGIAGRRGLIADTDSGVVASLRDAGAIIVGSTNMEEAALGALTDNPFFGRCINPLGDNLTPGGSSGGSAAAVAAGFVDLALGTDTMGSVRVPAAYCGIAGIKPTFGAIDCDGLAMLCPSLDTIGPMAREVRLLWPALKALGNRQALAKWEAPRTLQDLAGVRFGVPTQLESVDCEPSVLHGFRRALEHVRKHGGTVETIDLTDWNPHLARRAGLLVIEAAAAIELADLIDQPGAISDHLRGMLDFGRKLSPEKLASAEAEVARSTGALDLALTRFDAILLPTVPQRAFPHGTPAPANQADLTALANFAGCPAVSLPVALPVALPGECLPASLQIIGRRWSDPQILVWAELLADSLTQTGESP